MKNPFKNFPLSYLILQAVNSANVILDAVNLNLPAMLGWGCVMLWVWIHHKTKYAADSLIEAQDKYIESLEERCHANAVTPNKINDN